jgi:Tfp pilus assembly protein PilE
MKFINFKKFNSGYGMLELVFYIAIFSITSILVVNSIFTMVNAFKETSANSNLIQSSKILERISREVRNSASFTVNLDSLILTNKNNEVTQFTLSGGDLFLYKSGILIGAMNSSRISISNFSLTTVSSVGNYVNSSTEVIFPLKNPAVKIEITIQFNHFGLIKEKTFHTTVVLRESY